MSRSWYTVKYVADLMRDEPRNIGVIVKDGDDTATKFLGQRPDGSIDGRYVGQVNSVDTYKLWVAHWQRFASAGVEELDRHPRRVSDNYYLSSRVDAVLSNDAPNLAEATNRLFRALVAEDRVMTASLKDQVEAAFQHLSLDGAVAQDQEVRVRVDDETIDTLHFDYQYEAKNRTRVMERVNLATDDRRTWDKVHAASWTFTRLLDDQDRANDDIGCIALVRTASGDSKQQLEQMRLLQRSSEVVDFSSRRAEPRLAELLAG